MLTPDRLHDLLAYDADTGLFTWNVDRSRRVKAGDIAGSIDAKGYVVIQVDGTTYKAHRLAFLYMTGGWPPEEIDHIDGHRTNNRWGNLRAATVAENKRNARTRKDNHLGVKGVCRDGNKFRAEIRHQGQRVYLGKYDTVAEAKAIRDFAARDLHGEFARLA